MTICNTVSSSGMTLKGYSCEFVDSVPEYLRCNKCTLVARRLTITTCCGESFCQTCIADTQEQGQPCPECGEKEFTYVKHIKNQKQINALQVYCSMKERGCVWSGTLDQLDTHLNPHMDSCQYVDTKCPLNCLQILPKNKVDQHVAQKCTKRPHVCQYCGFKATYEVVDIHLPECKYVPLQCPNMCGVSCERELMEDHMKICRLEKVECEFSSVGCDSRVIREDQDEHARQNIQKHLTLTASLAVETKEQLQRKLLDQNKKHEEEEEKMKKTICKQEEELREQGKRLDEQEKKLQEKEEKLRKQEKKIKEQEKKQREQESKLEMTIGDLRETLKNLAEKHDRKMNLVEQSIQKVAAKSEEGISDFTKMIGLNKRFMMTNFSKEKAKDKCNDWKTPVMYTHVGGYKFCIGVDANGCGMGHGWSTYIDIWSMPGEFDSQLKWPARAQFTIELINQRGGENATHTTPQITWGKPKKDYECIVSFSRITFGGGKAFIKHSDLDKFLNNDTLHFFISRVDM